MQFSLSTLLAIGTSLSVVAAAPTAQESYEPSCYSSVKEICFQGADAASAFTISVCLDGTPTAVGHDYLSISRITYDVNTIHCTFRAEYDGSGAANQAAYACGDPNCTFLNVGPPQPVYSASCTPA